MTDRYSNLSKIWASDGVTADPDLDTEHPAFTQGKYILGWTVQREPHQWQNYLNQITDLKLQLIASEQFLGWEDAVEYQPNAVVRYGDALYRNILPTTVMGNAPDESSDWEVVLFSTADDFSSALSYLKNTLSNHVDADNPHNDNIHQIGGYDSDEIDKFLNDPTSPQTIVYHKARTGAVHGETAEQVGTLPASGGEFTGDVKFTGGLSLGNAVLSADGPDQLLGNDKGAIYLSSTGKAYTDPGKGEIVTEANFDEVQVQVNNLFSLPPPLCVMNFASGSFSQIAPGNYYFDYSVDQSFESSKGWVIAEGVTIYNLKKVIEVTNVFEYYVGDVRKVVVVDTTGLEATSLSSLAHSFDENATHFTCLTTYPKLTKYQKSNIHA